MHDHHPLAYRRTRHVLERQRNRLPGHRCRDVGAFALHGLDDSRCVGTVGVRAKEHRIAFLDRAAVEQAVYDCANIGHRPDICHRELFQIHRVVRRRGRRQVREGKRYLKWLRGIETFDIALAGWKQVEECANLKRSRC
jgi:hypothetical protein